MVSTDHGISFRAGAVTAGARRALIKNQYLNLILYRQVKTRMCSTNPNCIEERICNQSV
jgi:hypothetical protein